MALLAALIVSVGAVVKWATQEPASPPTARPPTPSAVAPPSPPIASANPRQAAYPIDDRGFVNSRARCDGAQAAVVIGRTSGSLVVICSDRSGRYGYRGVRLSDDAMLATAARSTPTHGFIAQHAGVTYSVSPAELRVTADGTVIKQEPMLDYAGPRS